MSESHDIGIQTVKSVLGISHLSNFKKEGHRGTPPPVNGHACDEWRSPAVEF